MSHPLHFEIGRFLSQLTVPSDCRLLLAPECGGVQNLPLFCSQQKSNDAEYCNVDMMVVKSGKIRFLLEIEESGLLPTKVCGKFLTSALSTHFIHDVLHNAATPMENDVTFVQVLDAEKLPIATKKSSQWEALARSIQNILPIKGSGITIYRLFFFRGVTEFKSDHEKKAEFERVYMQACTGPLRL